LEGKRDKGGKLKLYKFYVQLLCKSFSTIVQSSCSYGGRKLEMCMRMVKSEENEKGGVKIADKRENCEPLELYIEN
jgi:hypothetical protein